MRAPVRGAVAIAQASVHPLLETPAPAPAAVDARIAVERRPWVWAVPVRGPFPDVAAHVVQPECAGFEALHRAGAVVFPARSAVRLRVAPRILEIAFAAASGVFPFGFARKP